MERWIDVNEDISIEQAETVLPARPLSVKEMVEIYAKYKLCAYCNIVTDTGRSLVVDMFGVREVQNDERFDRFDGGIPASLWYAHGKRPLRNGVSYDIGEDLYAGFITVDGEKKHYVILSKELYAEVVDKLEAVYSSDDAANINNFLDSIKDRDGFYTIPMHKMSALLE